MGMRKSALLSLILSFCMLLATPRILLSRFAYDEYRTGFDAGHLARLHKNTVKQLANRLMARLLDKLKEFEN